MRLRPIYWMYLYSPLVSINRLKMTFHEPMSFIWRDFDLSSNFCQFSPQPDGGFLEPFLSPRLLFCTHVVCTAGSITSRLNLLEVQSETIGTNGRVATWGRNLVATPSPVYLVSVFSLSLGSPSICFRPLISSISAYVRYHLF